MRSWKANSFLPCRAFPFLAKVEVAGVGKASGVELLGEWAHQKHLEMFSSGRAQRLKTALKKKFKNKFYANTPAREHLEK